MALPTAQQVYDTFFPGNTGQSWTYGSVHGGETEQGTDIYMPAGTPVKLPAGAKFVWTNGYQSVFQLASGEAISITHILAKPFKSGQNVAAGTVVGTVAPLSATPKGYFSSAEHIELGVYASPQAAETWQQTYTRDPVSFLQGLKKYGAAPSAPTPAHNIVTDPGGTIASAAGGALAALNPLNGIAHLLLVGALTLALIGVLLILLAQLGHKTGVVSPAALAAVA